MAKTPSFTKRSLITKANSRIVISAGIAAFVVIFSIVASRALISQASYQNRVIDSKKKALATLESDLAARDSLVASYRSFIDTPQNVLGGDPDGELASDGDNAKIVLDALPSKYDFPALTNSIEQLIIGQGMGISSIAGIDDALAQTANEESASPSPIAMPFQVQVGGSYDGLKSLVGAFERSIRPMQLQKLDVAAEGGAISAGIDVQTYYQPAKSLKITTEVVK